MKTVFPRHGWNGFELRVEKNTHLILDLLDEFSFKPKATFFILGWVACRCPDLVREIIHRGHEVASHGYGHTLCSELSAPELAQDVIQSKKMLEDIAGQGIDGYRAPSFSISDAMLDAVRKAGYLYDSSYNSFSAHGRYGKINLNGSPNFQGIYDLGSRFFEIPISNLEFKNFIIPMGGGGYFRLYPLALFCRGVQRILNKEKLFVYYAHPWEFDPCQPRIKKMPLLFRFRHYVNLARTENKLRGFIHWFETAKFMTMSQYKESICP